MRIPVGIVTGVILWVWAYLIGVFILINFIWVLISGKRIKDVAELCEIWNTQKYTFFRYMAFLVNDRPFPFAPLARSISAYKK